MSYTNTFRKILKESEEPEDNSRLIDNEEDDFQINDIEEISTSAEGSVNGKKLGRKRRFMLASSKNHRQKSIKVPFKWEKLMPSSITTPSNW